ncbi:hypothetical protein G7Y89_g12929 [Cudoniella acicularis]|uniref:Amino acid transporter n=1 Tax=Cudoniella acicularis TaxID=354080 RepID=A0A8H4RAI3_9HELO|nr:hypothetical protein G7Y89_g12929 [Cudoniella acicularis]
MGESKLQMVEDKVEAAPVGSISSLERNAKNILTKDEYQLAQLGYKQEFFRNLGLFENWAATFTSMNFASGIPVLFGWVMYTGGPTAAFANWTMVGGLSFVVSLSMAEIAAALPTAGGIYYWAYRLGGAEWGYQILYRTIFRTADILKAFSFMDDWMVELGSVVPGVQQGSTNFLLSALEIQYPDAEILGKGWFAWLLTSIGMFFAMAPNIINQKVLQWYFRFAIVIFHILVLFYWIWFPIKAAQAGGFQPGSGVFNHFYNGINDGDSKQASDAYCWVISILFGAWVFYGYDASVHLAEETKEASGVVAKGMWMSTLSAWLMSVPTLIIILFCLQDFDGIISGTYANNWAEYLVQLVGPTGATAILALLWVDSTCATASCFMSAQRVTYAISRDGILPGSKYFRRLSTKNHMPIHAAFLVLAMSITITTAVIGSVVAFSAITATATIATNVSYLFPIIARHTVGRHTFEPAKWNLGRWTIPCAVVSSVYISFLVVVLLLPQVYPVTGETLNYAPIMIGGKLLLQRRTYPFHSTLLPHTHLLPPTQGTFAFLDSEIVQGQYNLLHVLMERDPGLAFLWLGAFITGVQKRSSQEAHLGWWKIDLNAAAWTGTFMSFIQEPVSPTVAKTEEISRSDECRLMYLCHDLPYTVPPLFPFGPFGSTALSDTNIDARQHAQCGTSHSLEYERLTWRCRDGNAADSSVRHIPLRTKNGKPMNFDIPVDYDELDGENDDCSEMVTRNIFTWLRDEDGFPVAERAIREHDQYSCDFGDLITRIAWIFILLNKDNGPSALDTLVYLCKQRSTSQCPNFSAQLKGTEMALKHIKTPATCCWYSVANADGKPMTDFTICPQCRAEVEYLLQTYKGWQPSSEVQNKFILAALEPCQATCSFIHGHRMWNYLQAIFLNDTPENFRDLAKLIDERACLAECREGVMAYGMYISLNNASCIVACEECAMDVIMPDIERGVLRWDQLSRYDGSKNGFSCSLKEARVRQL